MRDPYINKGTIVTVSATDVPKLKMIDGVTNETSMPLDQLTTSATYACSFKPDKTELAFSLQVSPFIHLYDLSTLTKKADISDAPVASPYGLTYNPAGTLLACAHSSSPYITVYNTSDWSKVTAPSTLPAGNGTDIAFNAAGTLCAISHATSPYITIYNTSDWSKVTNPSTLPAGNGNGVCFSPNGTWMVVAHVTTPYITIYNTSDWSKVTNPSTLPSNSAYCCQFSPDSSMLAVGYQASPYIVLYNTSDWSTVTVDVITAHVSVSRVEHIKWIDNTSFAVATSGVPGVVIYSSDGSIIEQHNQIYSLQNLDVVPATGWEINGTISESLTASTWICTAYDLETGTMVGEVTTTGTTFTIPVANPFPCKVIVKADQGLEWMASEVVTLNELRFPTNPVSKPYYYKCTTAGTTGSTEPVWPTSGTVADGSAVWTYQEGLIQPVIHAPLIPTSV